MMLWIPQAILANVTLTDAIEAKCVAFAPVDDPRVQAINNANPIHAAFLNRFIDLFGRPIRPTVLLVNSSAPSGFRSLDALASIRDILSVSIVPRARARAIQQKIRNQILFSRTFDFYPWMVGNDNERLVALTPAIGGSIDINEFCGQASPEVRHAEMSSSDLDKTLFHALVERWSVFCRGEKPSWDDTKLMRSLNMAYHACQLPAGQDAEKFDYGRILALWVSAFEILVHPGKGGKPKINYICELLRTNEWMKIECKEKACAIYKKMYKLRNFFLHGNPVSIEQSRSVMAHDKLFGLSSQLYRMALASFVNLKREQTEADQEDIESIARKIEERITHNHYQRDFEEAISKYPVS